MKTLTMILASAGLAVMLGSPAVMADPAPAGQKAACTGKDCNKALNATHNGIKGNKKAGHHAESRPGHKTAAHHAGKHQDKKDCKTGQDCQHH